MPDYQDIALDRTDEGRATLWLDRPDSMNTISNRMKDEILECLDHLRDDDSVRVVVFRGKDGVFCAGADVSSDGDGGDADAPHRLLARRRRSREFFTTIDEFPKPTVAAIEGYALGGGCELACCVDTRIAAESATVGVPEIQLGVIPAGGGTQKLARLIGVSRARDMVLRGQHYDAAEMAEFGFVHELCAAENLDETLDGVVEQYKNRPPIALEIAKGLVTKGDDASVEAGFLMESLGASVCSMTEDAEEGMAAFRGKRDPEFQGR